MGTNEQLVERERELKRLEGLIEASSGEGRVVIIEAAAGLGKTALLRHAEAQARACGLQVLSARGSELELEYPFALVGQMLAPVLAAASPAERQRLLSGAARLAAPVLESPIEAGADRGDGNVGASGKEDGALPGDDSGYASLHGLYWLLSNIAADRPVLLSIDDLHWGDAGSLRFLAFLEARIEGMPLLVLCARRPREPDAEAALLERVGSGPHAVTIRPRPLSSEGSAELLQAAFGGRSPAQRPRSRSPSRWTATRLTRPTRTSSST